MITNTPIVSIIMATYNGSHLLKYSIGSLLNSDFNDWELIVVGDHVIDDTEEVVLSFQDQRISFYNLDENSGQQAVPNNFGITKAHGKYITFLNQDDMYFKNHLSRAVKLMEKIGCDILCVPQIGILPTKEKDLKNKSYSVEVKGIPVDRKFTPYQEYIASSWVMKSDVPKKVGLWKVESKLFVTPSQEWMFRAWKLSMNIQFDEHPTVLLIHSGLRKNFFIANKSVEHEYFFDRIIKNDLREELLEKALNKYVGEYLRFRYYEPRHSIWRILIRPFRWILIKWGIHPKAIERSLFYGRGGFIKHYRRHTGLDS